MGVAFAAAIARGLDAHQAGIHRVLDVAAQDAVFDQHILLAGVAFVVHVQRAPAVGHGAVIQHGDALGRHTLTNAATESARSLAVEVALQPVAHGFVQQHAGPAIAQHHGHLACGRGAGFEVDERGRHGFLHIAFDHGVVKISQAKATTAAGTAHFAAAVLLGDHRQGQTNQRAHIGRQRAIGAGHHDHVVFGGQARHDLHNAGVFSTCDFFHMAQQVHFGRAVECRHRVQRGVERTAGRNLSRWYLDALVLRGRGNRAHRHGRIHQGGFGNVIGVGKGGFLARNGPHTHTLVDAEAASLDDALFQAPAFGAGVLKVKIGVIDRVRLDGVQGLSQMGFVKTKRVKQQGLGRGQAFNGGFA